MRLDWVLHDDEKEYAAGAVELGTEHIAKQMLELGDVIGEHMRDGTCEFCAGATQ